MDSTYLNDQTEPTNPHGLSARSIHTLWAALDARMGFLKGRGIRRNPRHWWESNASHLVAVIQWIEALANDVGYDLDAPIEFDSWPYGWTEIIPSRLDGEVDRPIALEAQLTERMIIEHVRKRALAADEAAKLRKEIKDRKAALAKLAPSKPGPVPAAPTKPALTLITTHAPISSRGGDA